MTLVEKVSAHPDMKAKELAKKFKTTVQSIYSARTVINKQQQSRPRKMAATAQSNGASLFDDIRVIKKIGIERVEKICSLLTD